MRVDGVAGHWFQISGGVGGRQVGRHAVKGTDQSSTLPARGPRARVRRTTWAVDALGWNGDRDRGRAGAGQPGADRGVRGLERRGRGRHGRGRPPDRRLGRPGGRARVDPEDFYDYQVNRPLVGTDAAACAGSRGPRTADLRRPAAGRAPRRRAAAWHRAEHAVAPVLRRAAGGAGRARRRAGGDPRARCWPRPRTPGRSRSAAPPPSSTSRTGSSWSSRRTRARPASSGSCQDACMQAGRAGRVVLGRRPPLPAAAARARRRRWRCSARSRTCSRSASRWATCPRTPAPGSAASPSWPRRTRTSAEYVRDARGEPGHRRAPRGQR